MRSKRNSFAVTATFTSIVAGMLVASGCNQGGSTNKPPEIAGSEASRTNVIQTKVAQIVQEQFGWKQSVTGNLRFAEDLKGDSLDAVELVMAIEEEFGIEIADEAAEKMRTVGDIISYVEKAVGAKRQ